jgi:diadenosine tetraphosphate (Ap4A) HIT family hydrolase
MENMFTSVNIKKAGVLDTAVKIKKQKIVKNNDDTNDTNDNTNKNSVNDSGKDSSKESDSGEEPKKYKSNSILIKRKRKVKKNYELPKGSVVILDLKMIDNVEDIFGSSTGSLNTQNGRYKSYHINTKVNVTGTARVEINPSREASAKILKVFNPVLIEETYDRYCEVMASLNMRRNAGWLFDILNGDKEAEKIVYNCEEFIVVIDWKCSPDKDGKYAKNTLHLLTVPREEIKSIRDLDSSHIGLLNRMMEKTYEICDNRFELNKQQIRLFYHYPPSTYQLHMHAQWIGNSSSSDFVRAKDAHEVVKNVGYDNEYYKGIMRYYRS